MEIAEGLGIRPVFLPRFARLAAYGNCAGRSFDCPAVQRQKSLKSSVLQKGETTMQASLSAVTKSSAIRVLLFSIALLSLSGARSSASDSGARVVKYSKEDIVQVHAKLRFSTLIVLPDDEEILDFTTGDREFWIINGSHNLCYVHPAQAGIKSNLNLITASGHVYSFLLAEISSDPNAQPDLKLFIEPKEGTSAGSPLRGYVRAADAEAYKKELADIHQQTAEQIRTAEAHAVEEVNQFRSSYATKLRFDYLLDAKSAREPFLVSAIYHDDGFTYIRCAAREKPALYEIKDGKPNLISFQLENGVYIVSKIVDSGYLAVGKKKLNFSRQVAGK
jgi:type IV secretory pathway VirB9-like protein